MTINNYRTALLASGAAIALMVVSVPAWADEISDLRSQIESMQDKISKMEADTASKKRIAAAAAVEAGDKPRTWKLPGTRTSMGIGGYVKLDMIWDLNGQPPGGLLDRHYSDADFGNAPQDNTPGARKQGQFRFHARQSRVWVQTWTPTDWGELHTHFEGDFFSGGSGVGSNVNNGYFANSEFRIRHAYGELGPVLAGQTWSTFNPVWAGAETIDFGGDYGANGVRTAQLRYTHVFPGGFTIMAALEDPGLVPGRVACVGNPFTATAASPAICNATGTGLNTNPVFTYPDVVLAAQYDFGNGRIWAGGMLRHIEYDNGNGLQDSTWGWQFAVAGTYRFTPRLAIGGIATVGKGTKAHYAGQYVEAVLEASQGVNSLNIEPVLGYSFYGWVQVKWTDTIRSNFSAGFSFQDIEGALPNGNKNSLQALAAASAANNFVPGSLPNFEYSAHVNLIWSPVPQVDFGIEYFYSFQSRYSAANSKQSRIQVGMLYRF